ncbi:MAG: hypothetical protein ACYCYE_11650 [Clostridia bacterium]
MDKRVKTIVSAAVITAAGIILPTLAALLVYGHSVNNFVISNYIFMAGILTSVAGGLWSILPFFMFKSKLRRTKRWEEVNVQKREGLMWEYILIVAGVLIAVVSYFIAVL